MRPSSSCASKAHRDIEVDQMKASVGLDLFRRSEIADDIVRPRGRRIPMHSDFEVGSIFIRLALNKPGTLTHGVSNHGLGITESASSPVVKSSTLPTAVTLSMKNATEPTQAGPSLLNVIVPVALVTPTTGLLR